MPYTTTSTLQDAKVDIKVVLAGLWSSTLFVFAYVDLFGFFRRDIAEGVLAGKVSGTTHAVDQTFLTVTTAYIVVPSLMVVFSLATPARVSRPMNIAVASVYAVTIIGSAIGETWTYYVIGSAVETGLLAAVIRLAWSWPRSRSME